MQMVRLAVASQIYALAALFLSLACGTSAASFISKSLADMRRESLFALGLTFFAVGMMTFVPPLDNQYLWRKVSHGIGIFGVALFLLTLASHIAR